MPFPSGTREGNLTQLQDSLRDYLAAEVRIAAAQITVDTPLISSGLVDSFALVGLVATIEHLSGVRIPDHCMSSEYLDSLALIDTLVSGLRAQHHR